MIKNLLLSYGYNELQINRIINFYPLNHMNEEHLYNKILDIYKKLVAFGYSEKQIIKMTVTCPPIFNRSIENINDKYELLIKLGYTEKQIIKITKNSPAIYTYSIKKIVDKIEDLMKLNYTKAQVINMTTELSSLFGLNMDNIKNKVEFYDSIGLHDIAFLKPKYLMQSINLSYARYKYLKINNIEIDISKYNHLFRNQKQFLKKFGITTKELLETYPYEEYKELQYARTI